MENKRDQNSLLSQWYLGVASSYKMTLFHLNFVKKSLQNAGFIKNKEKSVSKPSQNLIWLGIRISLKNGFYCIPTEKLSVIKNLIVLHIEKIQLHVN